MRKDGGAFATTGEDVRKRDARHLEASPARHRPKMVWSFKKTSLKELSLSCPEDKDDEDDRLQVAILISMPSVEYTRSTPLSIGLTVLPSDRT